MGVNVTLEYIEGFEMSSYIIKDAPSFSGSLLLRTPQLSVLDVKKSYDG